MFWRPQRLLIRLFSAGPLQSLRSAPHVKFRVYDYRADYLRLPLGGRGCVNWGAEEDCRKDLVTCAV